MCIKPISAAVALLAMTSSLVGVSSPSVASGRTFDWCETWERWNPRPTLPLPSPWPLCQPWEQPCCPSPSWPHPRGARATDAGPAGPSVLSASINGPSNCVCVRAEGCPCEPPVPWRERA